MACYYRVQDHASSVVLGLDLPCLTKVDTYDQMAPYRFPPVMGPSIGFERACTAMKEPSASTFDLDTRGER